MRVFEAESFGGVFVEREELVVKVLCELGGNVAIGGGWVPLRRTGYRNDCAATASRKGPDFLFTQTNLSVLNCRAISDLL